jgi:hypothetical protein
MGRAHKRGGVRRRARRAAGRRQQVGSCVHGVGLTDWGKPRVNPGGCPRSPNPDLICCLPVALSQTFRVPIAGYA